MIKKLLKLFSKTPPPSKSNYHENTPLSEHEKKERLIEILTAHGFIQ